MMPRSMIRTVLMLVVLAFTRNAAAQINCNDGMGPLLDRDDGLSMSGPEFIREVAAKERVFARSFATMQYTADMLVQTLQANKVDGEYRQTVVHRQRATGSREMVADSPVDTLSRVRLTPREIEGLLDSLPFALTPDMLADRDIVYAGSQHMGERVTSVFDVMLRDGQTVRRGFVGRVWVRAEEGVIVKTCGHSTALPIAPMRYEVIRLKAPGALWLPARVRADEVVSIGTERVHVRVNVRYHDFKPRS